MFILSSACVVVNDDMLEIHHLRYYFLNYELYHRLMLIIY